VFLNRSFSYLRYCCIFDFRCRSFPFLNTSLQSYYLSFVHCISSILSDFVCFLCRSLSFLPQLFNFFVFVSRSFSYLRHCCIFVFRCCSFSLLRCCYLIIFRSSTVFRQFSPTLFAFSVVLCLSCLSAQFFNFFVFVSRSFSYLRHCYIFVFRCLSFPFLRHCCLIAFRSSTVFRQFSMTLFALPLVPFSLRQFFNFFAFLNRSFSYLRHCCIFVFRWRSFSFLRRCYLIVFRSSTIFRQFSPTLFAFSVVPCLSYLSSLISLSLSVVLSRTYVTAGYLSFAVFPSLSYVIAVLLPFVRPCISSILTGFVCFLCRSFLSYVSSLISLSF